MTNITTIAAERRLGLGKGAARAARRANRVPGIIYGNQQDPVAINVDAKSLTQELKKSGFLAKLFDVKIDGKAERALPRALQRDPVKGTPIHIDFMRVSKDSLINVAVPLRIINEEQSPGLKRGGVLNLVMHKLELSCPADHIPETIEIDLDGLEIHDTVHLDDLKLPTGAKPAHPERDQTIATVVAPSSVKAEAEAAAAEAEAGEAEAETEEETPTEGEA